MLTIDDFINKAIEINKFKSDAELARAIGKTPTQISNYRKRKTWPSEESMIQLAKFAQENPETALVNLSIWRSEGQARQTWQKVLSTMTITALFFLFILSPSDALASVQERCTQHTLHPDGIHLMRLTRFLFWISLIITICS
jgi:hypothetical protein